MTVFDAMPETSATLAVERIGRLIPPRRAELDKERRFPSDLGSDAVGAGLFEQLRSREFGGSDGLIDWFRNGIRAAWWDGSFGWLITQGSAGFGMVAVGAPELAARVYDRNRFSVAGTNAGAFSLQIRSERINVNGTVPFTSGCEISSGLFALGFPAREQPSPDTARYVFAPTTSWEIGRDWDAIGLRGTGSHSITANELQIPAADSFLVNRPPETGDPLRVLASAVSGAWCIAMSVAATQLGIARRALDETYQIAATKAPRPSPDLLDDRAPVRERLMEHEASWHHAVHAAERALEGRGQSVSQAAPQPGDNAHSLQWRRSQPTERVSRLSTASGESSVPAPLLLTTQSLDAPPTFDPSLDTSRPMTPLQASQQHAGADKTQATTSRDLNWVRVAPLVVVHCGNRAKWRSLARERRPVR